MCGKFRVDPFSHSFSDVENVSANQKQGRPQWISDRFKSNNTWSGPHKEHVWQVWCRFL